MPNVKSAAKRLRQSQKARLRNRAARSTMRTAVKKLRDAIAAGNVDAARVQLPQTISVIDSTARKGVIHANTAARSVSRLSAAVAALASDQAAAQG